MDWEKDYWESIARGITDNSDDEGDALAGGMVWEPLKELNINLWYYHFQEVMSNLSLKIIYDMKLCEDISLSIDTRYAGQYDTGDALDGKFKAEQIGAVVAVKGHGAELTGMYGVNNDNAIRSPFGNDKVVDLQVQKLGRAEERAYALKLDYDFGVLGISGLSSYIFYGRFNTPDSGEKASPDTDEIDFNLQYAFDGPLKGLSVRLRHAIIDRDEDCGGKDEGDSRVYLVYKF